jgi:FAD/FMN-containing dehydrogenase/Fe-S oxidoreductase
MGSGAPNPEAFEDDLRRRVRGGVHLDPVSRGLYATDASNYQILPVAVATPIDEADVAAAVETARGHGVSILPRGGGTSLSGQTAGASLVLDLSRSMNRVLEVDPEGRRARVQPGVVRDELNALLAPHRLHLAPDPATSNRANVGGMIGNNSSGTRSIVYGKTIDHVLGLRVLLSDGVVLDLRRLPRREYDQVASGAGREAGIYAGVRSVVEQNREEIARRFPKVMRRVGGYNLDAFLRDDAWNLADLVTGSEGTLAVVLEATLNLEPLPEHAAVCVAHFHDLFEAIEAVPGIVERGPSAVEVLDRTVIDLARANPSIRPLCDFIEGDPAAVLLIEFFGDTADEARGKAEGTAGTLRRAGHGYACPLRLDPEAQARVWAVRKHGLGILLAMKGDRKPIPLIEDACVPVPALPEYVRGVSEICRRHETPLALYAHASVGVLHLRPVLDLKRADDIERMKAISQETFELVRSYGGAWSGEHGDGLVRSAYMERFYGPEIYAAFGEVKRLFDPAGLMNPGKIVDGPPIDRDLRYGTAYRRSDLATAFHYRDEGGFALAVEMCTGVGACRKTLEGTMCPSYMATRDEEHSTRGRANALRLAMTGQLGEGALAGERLFEVLDLCLSCKGCKAECPSRVDMAKLKSEFLRLYHDRNGTSLRDRLIAGSPESSRRLAGRAAPFVNFALGTAAGRRILQELAGIDARRTLPPYARETFSSWFARRERAAGEQRSSGDARPTVALFADTYLECHEPRVGRAAVELLESCGYRVELAAAGCCQRPRISHGFLREARREGERTLRALDSFASRDVPVVVCEPGCASALTDDLPDLVDDADLGARVAANVFMIDRFLEDRVEAGEIPGRFYSFCERIALHGHCHQKALFGTGAMKSLLARAGGLRVSEIDSGCCGMAGSFGYEKEHHDLSLRIGEDRLFPALRNLEPGTTVVACGFSCRHQIEHALGIRALHWVETLRSGEPDR